jgi:hypothetical protein
MVSAAPLPPQVANEPSAPTMQVAPPASDGKWVQNHLVTELWSGPDSGAVFFGWLRKFSYLRIERAQGNRLYVFNPRSNNFAFVDATAVGPSGPPPPDYLEPIKELARLNLPARIVGKADVYAEPAADDAVWLRNDWHNAPVIVEAKVKGDGASDWYRLDSGEFISGEHLRLPGPPAASYPGKWIDADLNSPTIVTAYEGNRPVASALAIRGVAAWQTPVGTFRIWRRVYNETMSSEGLGIPRNAPGGYYVQNVLFTQYFSGDGAAIHYNYWSSNWGYPGSHGCLGMTYEDSLWFWNWAEVGTPVVFDKGRGRRSE